jgi:hypothetical protein
MREWLQNMRWFSIHLPIPTLFIMEVLVTNKFVRDRKFFTFNVIVGAFLSSVLAILWTLNPMNSADETIRHFLAKIVIVGSFLMIIAEIIIGRISGLSGSHLSARICFSIIKPMIMLNGHTFQVALVACIGQHLALRALVSRLPVKPSSFTVAMLFYLQGLQYWYRTNHRNRFSSIKLGSVFLGFTSYNYYLHGVLALLITYSS